jgi:hypothetical protein
MPGMTVTPYLSDDGHHICLTFYPSLPLNFLTLSSWSLICSFINDNITATYWQVEILAQYKCTLKTSQTHCMGVKVEKPNISETRLLDNGYSITATLDSLHKSSDQHVALA